MSWVPKGKDKDKDEKGKWQKVQTGTGGKSSGKSSGKSGGKGKAEYKWQECHTGNVEVFTSPHGVIIVAGGKIRGAKPFAEDIDVIVPLNGDDARGVVAMSDSAKALFPKTAKTTVDKPIVSIDVPDFSVPDLPAEFWKTFADEIDGLGEGKKVLFYCVGGHGRTGTALAILHGLWYPEKGDPVKIIREKYCKRAVESISQIAYIEGVTGIDVNEEPSKSAVTVVSKKGQAAWDGWRDYYDDYYASGPTHMTQCDVCGIWSRGEYVECISVQTLRHGAYILESDPTFEEDVSPNNILNLIQEGKITADFIDCTIHLCSVCMRKLREEGRINHHGAIVVWSEELNAAIFYDLIL